MFLCLKLNFVNSLEVNYTLKCISNNSNITLYHLKTFFIINCYLGLKIQIYVYNLK